MLKEYKGIIFTLVFMFILSFAVEYIIPTDKAVNEAYGATSVTKEVTGPPFVVVEESAGPVPCVIVYHRDTKVMYCYFKTSTPKAGKSMTVLVNPDGTPMLYEE